MRITSISRDGGATTLTWTSQPNEFYSVYWTDSLTPYPFWRIAAVNVPSGGTNTTWSEGGEQNQMNMATGNSMAAMTRPVLTAEERAARLETIRLAKEQGRAFLEAQMEKLKQQAEALRQGLSDIKAEQSSNRSLPGLDTSGTLSAQIQSNSVIDPPGCGEGGGTNCPFASSGKFYRVVRSAVMGFVDGWGPGADNKPDGLTNIIAVSASHRDSGAHSLALRSDGTVVAWGNNWYGQTNVPTGLEDVVAVAAGGRHSVALQRDGTVRMWGDTSLGQTSAPASLTNVVDVKAGLWHTIALMADGTVAAWGDLFNRSNAVPAGLSNVIAISAGPRQCLALKSDHTVTAWGFDLVFRGFYRMTNVPPYLFYLGTNPPTSSTDIVWLSAESDTPTNLPPGRTVFGNFFPTNVPCGLTNAIAVASGMEHNAALLADGHVLVWSQTNDPAVLEPLTNAAAIASSWHYVVAVGQDATLSCWGAETPVSGLDAVVGLSAGASHTLVIRTNDEAPVIRRQPRRAAVPVGFSTNILVQASSTTDLAYQWQRYIANCGSLADPACWSDLSDKTTNVLSFPSLQDSDDGWYRVKVSTPNRSIFSRPAWVETIHPPVLTNLAPPLQARVPQGDMVCFRVGVFSKGSQHVTGRWYKDGTQLPNLPPLGPGVWELPAHFLSLTNEGEYSVVACNEAGCTSQVWQASITLQGEVVCWGDDEVGQTDSTRSETNLVAISAGQAHTLALREDGTVVAWGWNEHGQTNVPPGLSNVVSIAAGGCHSAAAREDGSVVAWGANDQGQTNVPAGLSNVTVVAAGFSHNLALRADGTVAAWGDSEVGQTNVPAGLSNVMAIAAGLVHSMALLSNGSVVAWGGNVYGQTDVPPDLTNIVAIAAGVYHSLALRADGTVVGWGYGGNGETNAPLGLTNAMRISAGCFQSMALRNDGTVVAWGTNWNVGQTNLPGDLRNIYAVSAGYYHVAALAYSPILNYPIDPAQDLLLLANSNSPESTNLLNYYLEHRPMVRGANTLTIECAAAESWTNSLELTNQLITPVLNWLASNPTKRPHFMVMMYGIPSRVYYTALHPDYTSAIHMRINNRTY